MLWTEGETSPNTFLEQMNPFRVVQYTWSVPNKTVTFLDVDITLKNNTLTTFIYIKPTKPHAVFTQLKFPPLPHQQSDSFLPCIQRTTSELHHLCY